MSEELVVLDTVAGRVEGEILLSYLRANGLECMLSQEGAASAYGISVGRMARVEILCPVSQEHAARVLIDQYYGAQTLGKT